jgi:hypothetical protein
MLQPPWFAGQDVLMPEADTDQSATAKTMLTGCRAVGLGMAILSQTLLGFEAQQGAFR